MLTRLELKSLKSILENLVVCKISEQTGAPLREVVYLDQVMSILENFTEEERES
jgi:hypothetical protein